jgi:ribosome biogenesis GTPase
MTIWMGWINLPNGKIIKALSGFYYVRDGASVFQCRARGNFRKKKITPLVGDLVEFHASSPTDGYILSIKPRKNALIRPPVANIDQALLVFSAKEPDFDDGLLDRFLVHVEAEGIEPVICLTKIDLLNEEELARFREVARVYEEIGYPFFMISSTEKTGLDALKPLLKNKTSVVAGQTGAGKSSLLNALNPELSIRTGEISEALGRGKHTTRHVEFLEVCGGDVADTPGFSALEFAGIEADGLPQYFPEMVRLASSCRFRGCTHRAEPGCAVKEAVENGGVSERRYRHYLQFYEEISSRKKRY